MADSRDGHVQSVERALDILFQFVRAPSLDVAAIQRRVRLPRPTLYRLLATMEDKKLLRSSGKPRTYELGSGAVELVNAWLSQTRISRVSSEYLRNLWECVGETTLLSVLSNGTNRVTIQQFRSSSPRSYAPSLGNENPLYYGASGKVILAFLATPVSQQIIKGAPKSIDRAQLSDELRRIRRLGYCVSVGEINAQGSSIATPIFEKGKVVAGAIAIALPKARLSRPNADDFVGLLLDTSTKISAALGAE